MRISMSVKLIARTLVAIGALSLLAGACAIEDESVGTSEEALTKTVVAKTPNTTYRQLLRSQQIAIEDEYVDVTKEPKTFDEWAVEEVYVQACWSYPGNIGCWIGDWLVSCEKNANTDGEWDCGAAHRSELD
jgi:hypothetical protein